MSTDARSADHTAESGDPLCALLAADSPDDSLVLLPSAVRRADALANQLRDAVRLRSGTSDPTLVKLLTAMESAAAAHEHFVVTWSDSTTLSAFTQEILEDDVCTLTGTWDTVLNVLVEDWTTV